MFVGEFECGIRSRSASWCAKVIVDVRVNVGVGVAGVRICVRRLCVWVGVVVRVTWEWEYIRLCL